MILGYGNTEKVNLSCLLESEGLQSQVAQQKDALAEKNAESNETSFSVNANSKKYNREKMDCESEETKTYKQHFMPGSIIFQFNDRYDASCTSLTTSINGKVTTRPT